MLFSPGANGPDAKGRTELEVAKTPATPRQKIIALFWKFRVDGQNGQADWDASPALSELSALMDDLKRELDGWELIHERDINVDSVRLTESGHVQIKARAWDSQGEHDTLTVHYGSGMYGAPRVGDTIIVNIRQKPRPENASLDYGSYPDTHPDSLSVEDEKTIDRAVMHGKAVRI